jgi:nuclear receptor co-repressor 1
VFVFFVCIRPQERRTGYEQFHPGPSAVDHDSLESKRPRLEQVSDSHFQRVSAAVLPLVHTLPEGLRSSADAKKVNIYSLVLWSYRTVMFI